jgi:hypothetical protein
MFVNSVIATAVLAFISSAAAAPAAATQQHDKRGGSVTLSLTAQLQLADT